MKTGTGHSEQLMKWLDSLALPALLIDGSISGAPIQFHSKAWRSLHEDVPTDSLCLYSDIYRMQNGELTENMEYVLAHPQSLRVLTVQSVNSGTKGHRWYRHTFCGFDSSVYQSDSDLVLIFEHDITWDVLESSRKEQKSSIDPLTGLLSRESFLNKLGEKLQGLAKAQDSLCLVFIDLNKFKPINDDYGHDVGDRLLSQIGERILSEMSHGNTAGRLGGDEFVLMLTGISHEKSINDFVNQMLERVFQPVTINNDLTLSISGSFGYACTQDPQASIEDLLKAADQAMYQHKNSPHEEGGLFGRVIDGRKIRIDTDGKLDGLKTNELEMYLYPIVSLESEEIIGFEVLPRWDHAKYGLLELEHFHPLLLGSEEGKLFDRWLIHTAARFSAEMKDKGFDIGIGINLTRRQLDDGSFVEFMSETIPYFPDGRVDITLEIVESPYFQQNHFTFSALQQAREMGGQVVLDHFGSDKSSINFVTQVPLDFIKLDKSLSLDLHKQPDKQRYVSSLIAFSHELGHPVVASGIESEADFSTLKALGCDLIQGALWLKPMTLNQVKTQLLDGTLEGNFKLRVRGK